VNDRQHELLHRAARISARIAAQAEDISLDELVGPVEAAGWGAHYVLRALWCRLAEDSLGCELLGWLFDALDQDVDLRVATALLRGIEKGATPDMDDAGPGPAEGRTT
jgi:hypothetical protein